MPKPIRKLPKVRIFQPDQLQAVRAKFACHTLTDVLNYIHSLDEYKSFIHTLTETNFTIYRANIQSGIAQFKECIDISIDLHANLSYEGSPVSLPEYITSSKDSKITSLDMLDNLPNYIRNSVSSANLSIAKGLKFVLTGRFQTDPLERRLSQYRGMSGGRFLVSLTEVLRSESIISYKILLKHDINYNQLTISSEEVEHQIEDFMDNVNLENIDSIKISEITEHVVGYVSGYITHRLLLRTNCHICIFLLQKDVTDNEWTNALDRGGLKLPYKLYTNALNCLLRFRVI